MAFIDSLRFPTSIALRPVGGPLFSTEVATVTSGREQRNGNWATPRHEFEFSTSTKQPTDWAAVRNCFRMARGRLHSFRAKDWSDFEVAAAESQTTLVSGSIYQLQKLYGTGTYQDVRDITKLVAGTVRVFRNGATDITGATTIDAATGRITVTGHTGGDVYTWSGQFDVPVRFNTDKLDAVVIGRLTSGAFVYEWQSVPLIEVRGE
jgi:uncharacterized protein (TIGR02217 family)